MKTRENKLVDLEEFIDNEYDNRETKYKDKM